MLEMLLNVVHRQVHKNKGLVWRVSKPIQSINYGHMTQWYYVWGRYMYFLQLLTF